MADLIDRDAVIKQIAETQDKVSSGIEDVTFYRAIKIIRNAPAVNRWISCSERLPERTGYYLVCDSTAEFDNIRGRQDVSKFVIGRHGGHWYGVIRREYITHWMPLPSTEGLT